MKGFVFYSFILINIAISSITNTSIAKEIIKFSCQYEESKYENNWGTGWDWRPFQKVEGVMLPIHEFSINTKTNKGEYLEKRTQKNNYSELNKIFVDPKIILISFKPIITRRDPLWTTKEQIEINRNNLSIIKSSYSYTESIGGTTYLARGKCSRL